MIKIKELKNIEANYFELTDNDKHSLYVYKVGDHYELPINEGFDNDDEVINSCVEFCQKNNLNYEITDSDIIILI